MTQHAHDHTHDAHNDHPLGFPYWHFFDIASDTLRSATSMAQRALQQAVTNGGAFAQQATRLLPITRHALRVLPIVGIAGETIHVSGPFRRAQQDWQEGRLSDERFAMLCTIYLAYAGSGIGGLLTAGVKEGITHIVRDQGLLDERYIPHTLYEELQHAGVIPTGRADAQRHGHDHTHAPEASAPAAPAPHDHGHDHTHGIAHCPVCASELSSLTPSLPAMAGNAWDRLRSALGNIG